MPCRRIAIVNCKGGVGKTTISVNLAAALAKKGRRVLLVDLDAQSNSSVYLMGIPKWQLLDGQPKRTVYAFMTEGFLSDAVHESFLEDGNGIKILSNLHLLPAIYELANLDHDYHDDPAFPYYYKFFSQIQPLFESYDYILFDCPPNLGRSCKCAVFASSEIVVPCTPDLLSNIGLRFLETKLASFRTESAECRKKFKVGYFPKIRSVIINCWSTTMRDAGLNTIRTRLENLVKSRSPVVDKDAKVSDVRIRDTVAVIRTMDNNLPAVLQKNSSSMKDDFVELADYIDRQNP
ncbi:MAG TPA: AAA family ATPase [Candidatus Methylacidiphilales bacterium]